MMKSWTSSAYPAHHLRRAQHEQYQYSMMNGTGMVLLR
jgi:hypothetical protein